MTSIPTTISLMTTFSMSGYHQGPFTKSPNPFISASPEAGPPTHIQERHGGLRSFLRNLRILWPTTCWLLEITKSFHLSLRDL
ncbi:hypothetical protein QR680_015479 [Steinernema hermaphroditum]|uniref:Uncharacterized protein n=1 Tax=Steinernema hermaphroditum TaxID=289476 RepID=A0AA39H8S9_9BILA|nr:hypothetical protein QR680_015479 [Steinernema hermaphroditum]